MHLAALPGCHECEIRGGFFRWNFGMILPFFEEDDENQSNEGCSAAVLTLHLSGSAFGGTIQSTPAPIASGPGLGFASVAANVTIQANNDNVPNGNAADSNIVVPLKRFDFADYIDIQFSVAASDGITEYQFSEFVDNNTGSLWGSYRMQLGFGTGGSFVPSTPGDGLDFDFPDYDTPPTSGAFPTVLTPNEDLLIYTGGIHGGGAQPYNF